MVGLALVNENAPLVSILTPSFNQARWLQDNLRSVACQTYPHIEQIVMDGGSTDGSVALLEAAATERGPERFRFSSEPDAGQSDAINKAFRESRGEIIGWINSDDAYFDTRVVELVVEHFASHPDVDVAYGHCLQITGEGQAIQVLWAPRFDAHLLRVANFLMQPPVFVRRRVLSDPMLDTSLHFALDYELWLRLAQQGRHFHRINRILAIDRHQRARKSATMKDVNFADLETLAPRYGLALGPEREPDRARFYTTQRLMGALSIPAISARRVVFTPAPNFKEGLLRRQILSRRSRWPEEYR